jgi:hypothetical protein
MQHSLSTAMFRVYKNTEFSYVSLNSDDDSEVTEAGVARPKLLEAVLSARINCENMCPVSTPHCFSSYLSQHCSH